jgi:hypothetical protein
MPALHPPGMSDSGARPRRALRARALLATGLALVAAIVLVILGATRAGRQPDQGAVHFLGGSDPEFDRYTRGRDPVYGSFLRRHFWRMVVYSPYFDDKTAWYPGGWVYKDAYAIYRGSALAREHPEWILKDALGHPLFIPFGCSQGSCPQYAADISNGAYRRYWLQTARATLAHGYRGLFIDDVNMEPRVSDGQGNLVAPLDRASGAAMSALSWRRYMAGFMQEVRTALPGTEIAHNVEWLADTPARTGDRYIAAEIRAADYVNFERGVNDSGIRGHGGPYSLESLLAYIDAVHALDRGIVLDGSASQAPGIEYSLASYLLISTGRDLVGARGMTPQHWWSGFDVNLGEALGPRRSWQGVLRRDFADGMTLVAAPEGPARQLRLPAPMRTLSGQVVSSVTLAPASGMVLRRL